MAAGAEAPLGLRAHIKGALSAQRPQMTSHNTVTQTFVVGLARVLTCKYARTRAPANNIKCHFKKWVK